TEQHEGRAGSWVPLYEDLRVQFDNAWDDAPDGAIKIFEGWTLDSNMRTRMDKDIQRAGLTPWERTFHNMRASRQTELTGIMPIDFVCSVMGNSTAIAQRHYLQPRDSDFVKATKLKCEPECEPRDAVRQNDTDMLADAPNVQFAVNQADEQGELVLACAPNGSDSTPKGI